MALLMCYFHTRIISDLCQLLVINKINKPSRGCIDNVHKSQSSRDWSDRQLEHRAPGEHKYRGGKITLVTSVSLLSISEDLVPV